MQHGAGNEALRCIRQGLYVTLPNLILVQAGDAAVSFGNGALPEMIHVLRRHLGMDIAFVSEFTECTRDIKLVDTDEEDCPISPGVCTPAEETYCRLIVDGKLPPLMPDINDFPVAAALPITRELRIGSYIAATIRLADGEIYGTFCCYSHAAEPSLNHRDLAMMNVCADMTARQLDKEREESQKRRESRARIHAILSGNHITTAYQPIIDLRANRVVGFEALSRFDDGNPPDLMFNEAHAVGLGDALDAKAIRLGLEGLRYFAPDVYVSVNIAPETILSPLFSEIFDGLPAERVTLEITEHAAVEQYKEIEALLRPIRARGLKLAVDDAGAGYASFRHILQLAPDRIKLDGSLTRQVDSDPARRALIAAFVRFSEDTGTKLIAEGVETDTELRALQDLGVAKAQGFFLSRPLPLQQAVNLLRS